ETPPPGSTGTTRPASITPSARWPRSSSNSTTVSPTPPTSTRLPKPSLHQIQGGLPARQGDVGARYRRGLRGWVSGGVGDETSEELTCRTGLRTGGPVVTHPGAKVRVAGPFPASQCTRAPVVLT